ncbi:MAG: PD40 domain-containing protein [Chloroflexi bacterium]|nr:PD40 domain-containing protein [Chloroflexota bacterium]
MRSRIWKKPTLLLGALVALVALLAAACASGVPQQDLDAAKAQLQAKEQELAQAKGQLSQKDGEIASLGAQVKGLAPTTIVQTGQLQPAPAGAQPTGWDTAESMRGGLTLFARYDSSGPDAYDVKKHPLVYVSSEGMAKVGSPGKNKYAGLYIIDANTKEVVASATYNLGYEHTGAGHTTGISPDGKWFYAGTTVKIDNESTPLVLIINARTLKLDKALKGVGIAKGFALHHSIGFIDSKGKDRVTLTKNSGPGFILDPKDDNRVVRAITAQDVAMLGHNYVTISPDGKWLYWALRPSSWGNEHGEGGVAKINLETGAVTYIWGLGEGANPLGMAHTADGKFTYINDAHGDAVYKIDNATNTIVGKTNAGVAGPYGLTLNWDETQLYTIGKGEGSHNTGHVIGVIDTGTKPGAIFRPNRDFNQPIVLGSSAKSIDHGILHPDPKVNELWVSNMAGWETIVLDLNTREVKAYIPTPNGGDTHSGGFVRYNPDWTGKLVNDMGGPKADVYAAKVPLVAAALAAK